MDFAALVFVGEIDGRLVFADCSFALAVDDAGYSAYDDSDADVGFVELAAGPFASVEALVDELIARRAESF